ncbi:putative spermidine synthase [Symbiodinium microadriaticum]|uniref:Putative spermidine synthase n=1 Tax=Symbiodinium microadriaticum TaxID=2951 RepID=A0A1Q9D308_SYMMI|nr:putative spermidine synthase [Symbiodinium microadriaticum]
MCARHASHCSPAMQEILRVQPSALQCYGGRRGSPALVAASAKYDFARMEGDGPISICLGADIMQRWQTAAAVILCILGTSTADDDSWCADVECVQDSGWQFVSACRKQLVRNVHYWRYTHESLALPALVAIGPQVKDVLVVGGADGGVVNLFLQSRDVQSVTWVSHLTQVTEVARWCMPSLVKLSDERLHRLTMNSDAGLMQVASESWKTKQFDIIVYDASSLQVEEKPLKKVYFQPAEIQKLRELLSSSGLLVASAGILRKPRSLQDAYSVLKHSFRKIWSLQHSAPDNSPEQGHSVAFVAGDGDISMPNQLTIPPWPDLVAANSPKESLQQVPLAPQKLCRYRSQKHFGRPLLDKTTPYQKLNVAEEPSSSCTALFLDEELQLTNVFGDFYHEALVHPAMAALGRRGRRVLVIGAGDGGVATALLRYPQVEKVIQVEIDETVPEVAQEFLPEIAAGYQDPRHELVIMDGVLWVEANHVEMRGSFDLCIIDSTDDPLGSQWSVKFFQNLQALVGPHGAVVQNIGSQMDELDDFRKLHVGFQNRYLINCNTPDYPSPYFIAFLTEKLSPHDVNWTWWTSLNISSVYFHPTIHAALLSAPRETIQLYLEGMGWQPHDASRCRHTLIDRQGLQKKGLEVARSVRAAPTPYGQPLEQPVYKDDKQGVNAFAVRPDLRLVAAARWDRRVELFDAKTATSLGRLACHDGGVLCVSFDRQRGALAAGGEDGRIAVWGLFSETYEGPFSSAAAQVLGQQSQEKPPAEGWLLLVAAVCSTSGQTTDVSTKPSKSALAAAQSKVAHGRDGDHTPFDFLLFVNCAFDIYGILLAAGKAGKAFYSTQKKCHKQDTEEEKRSCASAVQGQIGRKWTAHKINHSNPARGLFGLRGILYIRFGKRLRRELECT